MGLEFLVAADIIRTVTIPTREGQLFAGSVDYCANLPELVHYGGRRLLAWEIFRKERMSMESHWQRIIENFLGRLDGPLHFRFIVQPLTAMLFAVIDGVKDAKLGKPAYFWTVLSNPEQRKERLKHGWKRVGKIFIIAILLDIFYQLKVLHAFYPGETLTVAFLLAIVPYLALRGPVNRSLRLFKKRRPEANPASTR
jgi:Protein of unknown function (DUF1622)